MQNENVLNVTQEMNYETLIKLTQKELSSMLKERKQKTYRGKTLIPKEEMVEMLLDYNYETENKKTDNTMKLGEYVKDIDTLHEIEETKLDAQKQKSFVQDIKEIKVEEKIETNEEICIEEKIVEGVTEIIVEIVKEFEKMEWYEKIRKQQIIEKISTVLDKHDYELEFGYDRKIAIDAERPLPEVRNSETKMNHILEAKEDTIIAFFDEGGVPETAAIKGRNNEKQLLKCLTQYEKEYIVPFEKVIWVKTMYGWPEFVYEMLKRKNEYKNKNNS